MRDEDKEADPEVQYIQMKNNKYIRKAWLELYYNSYEHCTVQQQLYNHNARRVKQDKEANDNNDNWIVYYCCCFEYCILFFAFSILY